MGTARAAEEKNISDIGSVTPVLCPDSSPWRRPITELLIARDRVRGDVGERLVEAAYWRRIVRCKARAAIRMGVTRVPPLSTSTSTSISNTKRWWPLPCIGGMGMGGTKGPTSDSGLGRWRRRWEGLGNHISSQHPPLPSLPQRGPRTRCTRTCSRGSSTRRQHRSACTGLFTASSLSESRCE
ncbi:hypothetical protein B0H14DRAFT_247474 [Mycena olivaceomarginata]|nr:hypothetical protein B0H14DRAFT_247474 [Mycena olivaceomarginata]